MTAALEVMEVLGSDLTDLSCQEGRASLAEMGRNHTEPREVRWENMAGQVRSGQVTSPYLQGGFGGTGGCGGGTKSGQRTRVEYPPGLTPEECPNYPFCCYDYDTL